MTSLVFIKAMAYFRGANKVIFEDIRQILPFVLHDKLVQNPDSPYFEQAGNGSLRADHVSWIRNLFDESCKEYDRLDLDRDDPVAQCSDTFGLGLDGVTEKEVRKRLAHIERLFKKMAKGKKFYGHMFDDLLKLKYYHQRYTNYLRWLKWSS